MQVLDSDASTASGGSPHDSPTTVFHLRHELTQAQKEIAVLRVENQMMEDEMTTAEARCQMPDFWLVSGLIPLCAFKYKKHRLSTAFLLVLSEGTCL